MDGSKNHARPTLSLRKDRYSALAKAKGWVTHEDQARGLGLVQSTISRTLGRSDQRPGADFIAAVLVAFPNTTFEDLFEIVDASSRRAAA
jgi:hypothetical protein